MKVTIYYKNKSAYIFTTTEENLQKIIEMIDEKYKDNIGFKIEREKER